jgi:hypothetical protein
MSFREASLKQKLSWRHYLFAGLMSGLVPFSVTCLQSALVIRRGFRLSFAMLYGLDVRMLLHEGFWEWAAAMALISFLILLPFLKFPILRRFVLAVVCVGWTWFIFAFCEAVTRGYET